MTGRYRLVESIGQGGMGRVWRAADEMLDRQVAIKEMRIDGLDPEDTRTRRERTLREARATARIDHPHVVRIYDVVDADDRLWIVMELVAGRSLERIVVEDGPLDAREAARVGLELVGALRQVHAQGVLHRDIKPGNVLVEHAGQRRVVLTDFGIAALQDAEALTMAGMLVGSPDYMAPERISGRPQGPPSDVWSLGATLCAALGGRSPFSRSTTLATLHAVLYEEPELPSGAGGLREILAALLEKDPSTRPGLEELEACLGEMARPPSPAPTPTTPPIPPPPIPTPTQTSTPTPAPGPALTPDPAQSPVPGPAPERSPVPTHDPAQSPAPGPERSPAPGPAPVHEPLPGPDLGPVRTVARTSAPDGDPTAEQPPPTSPDPAAGPVPPPRPSPTPTRESALSPKPGPSLPPAPETGQDRPAPGTVLPESSTRALLDARHVRAARQTPADRPEAAPAPDEQRIGTSDLRRPRLGSGPAAEPEPEPGNEPEPEPGNEPEPEPGTEPEPETERHSVHDAVPIQRAPTRRDPIERDPTGRGLIQRTPTRKVPPDFRKRPQKPSAEPSAEPLAAPAPEIVPTGPEPSAANASTEVPSAPRTEPGSHASSASRAETGARTASRLPTEPVPVVRPAGELPGPVGQPGTDESRGPGGGHGRDLGEAAGAGDDGTGNGGGDGDGHGTVRTGSRRPRRRAGLAAAAGVAGAGAVAWAVIAMTGGSPGTGTGATAGSSAPKATSATGTGPGTGTPSSAAPTVEGTSRPPSLPPGAHREAGGYAWVTPEGWRRDLKTGSEVHYTAPDGTQELAAKSSLAKGNLMDTWRTSEQDARQGRDYRKIRLERTTFRGRSAIVWEYTFTLGGVSWHARLLGFDADGKSYQINTWYHQDIEDRALTVYNQVRNSFTVL